jgi:hypothetical protein
VTTEEGQHRIAEANASTSVLQFRVRAGKSYLLARRDNVRPALPLSESSPATTPKFLGNRSIGLAKEAHKE